MPITLIWLAREALVDEITEKTIDRHFNRVKVIVSAIGVAVTVFFTVAHLVDRIQSDIHNVAIEHQRDYGELRTIIRGCTEVEAERGVRIRNLEQQVYDLRFNTAKRPDHMNAPEGK